MLKAENADNVPLDDGLTVPDETARRQDRIAKLEEAKRIIEARFSERKSQAEENKRRGRTRKNRIPRKKGQLNFTDPQSRIMMSKDGYIQGWNAQVAVDTEGSMLIVGQRLTEHGKHLMDLGYEVTEKKLGADHSWQMWTSDPSGTRIEFHHYTPESCQLTRKNCVLG